MCVCVYVAVHQKRGSKARARAERDVLGTGTQLGKRVGEGLKNWPCKKKRTLVTDVAQKGFLGAYLLITFTFSCQHDQLVGGLL